MTDTDQKQFLSVLQAKEADIAAGLGRRDGLAVQAEADVFDEIQNVIDQALLVRNLDRSSDLLREVRSAVERIASGEFGSCQECGEEINPTGRRSMGRAMPPLPGECRHQYRNTESGMAVFD